MTISSGVIERVVHSVGSSTVAKFKRLVQFNHKSQQKIRSCRDLRFTTAIRGSILQDRVSSISRGSFVEGHFGFMTPPRQDVAFDMLAMSDAFFCPRKWLSVWRFLIIHKNGGKIYRDSIIVRNSITDVLQCDTFEIRGEKGNISLKKWKEI